MRKVGIVAASVLVLSGGMVATVSLAQAPMVSGQVTKIDEAAREITLKHGADQKPRYG
jgi:Cu/Ag efflux protein CusF